MEPLFVDDFQNEEFPTTIKCIIRFLEHLEVLPSRNDIIVGLIYILTLESGFTPSIYKENNSYLSFNLKKIIDYCKELPPGWKQNETYKLTFYLKGFEQHQCVIVCCPSLDDLLVNCYVTGIENARYTAYLDTLTYFTSSSVSIHNLNVQNLRGLSFKVKEIVCYPAKQAILRQYSYFSNCLEALPEEVIIYITNYLKTPDFVRFGMTCKRFNRIMKTPILWFKRIERDLMIPYNSHWNSLDWSQLVKMYLTKRKFTVRHYNPRTICMGIPVFQ